MGEIRIAIIDNVFTELDCVITGPITNTAPSILINIPFIILQVIFSFKKSIAINMVSTGLKYATVVATVASIAIKPNSQKVRAVILKELRKRYSVLMLFVRAHKDFFLNIFMKKEINTSPNRDDRKNNWNTPSGLRNCLFKTIIIADKARFKTL